MSRTLNHHVLLSTTAVDDVRSTAPLVQCITNSVTTNFVANALLAIGASPAMVDVPTEAGMFAKVASSLLINVGTPSSEQRIAMLEAASHARDARTPWVLDPVAVGTLPIRTAVASQLLGMQPTAIRGNASEICALAGVGSGGRGVDSQDSVDAATAVARCLAERTGAIVAVSGAVDFITDGTREAHVANGSPLLTKITGAGCALGAVVAAFVAQRDDAFVSTVTACTAYAVAAEIAAVEARGPGSFVPLFLDALASVDAVTVESHGRVR